MNENILLQVCVVLFGLVTALLGKMFKDHLVTEKDRLLATVCKSRRYAFELRGKGGPAATSALLVFTIMREVLDPGGKRRREL